jgi:adenosylhomocysteine nucleosidase
LIAVIVATALEAEPLLARLGFEEMDKKPVMVYKSGRILLAICGIGKTNAAIATTYCCLRYRPTWVLNAGAAGALGRSFRLGEWAHITKVIEPDRPLLHAREPHVHIPYILDGFREAVLATVDRPIIEAREREAVSALADLVDMEGASTIQAARRFGVPSVLFKFVSDTPDHSAHDDIVSFIREHRGTFCDFIADSVIPLLARQDGGNP